MKAHKLYIARKVSEDENYLYAVPVTRPDSKPSVFDDHSVKLDFTESEESPEAHVGTFWKEETGFIKSQSDTSTYSRISPLDAYEILEEYLGRMKDHVNTLQGETIEQAEKRLEDLTRK